MAYKLKTEIGKAIYAARKYTVEPVIGIIKEVLASASSRCGARERRPASGAWCAWRSIRSDCIACS